MRPLEGVGGAAPPPMTEGWVSKDRLRRISARWHDAAPTGRLTYALPPGTRPPAGAILPPAIARAFADSDTGAFLFYSLHESLLLLPPFPVERAREREGWHSGELQSLLDKPRRTAVLLLRLGGYAVGIYNRDALVISKVGHRFVKGRHSKGGSSAPRFARRREGQARMHFDDACETLRNLLEPERKKLNHFLVGGDRMTLQAFEKRCPFIRSLDPIRLRRVLNVPDPRLPVLESLGRDLYMSRLLTFQPATDFRALTTP